MKQRFIYLILVSLTSISPVNAQDSSTTTSSSSDDAIMQDLGLDGADAQPASMHHTPGAQLLVYQGSPLKLTLAVDKERHIVFKNKVELGMDPALDTKLGVQVYDQNMLLTAKEPFTARVDVRDLVTGKIVPVDIEAYHDLSQNLIRPVSVYLEPPRPAVLTTESISNGVPTQLPLALMTPGSQKPVDMVDIMRFAAQQYYAPSRKIEALPGASFKNIKKKPVRLYRGDVVNTTPDAAWQVGGYTVTAVRVENKTRDAIVLDPRNIVGRFHSAVFHHTRLAPKGGQDTTMLYLISKTDFQAALAPYATSTKGEAL